MADNSTFVNFFCAGDPWGPWDTTGGYKNFTPCFAGLLTSCVRALVLPLLVFRFVQAFVMEAYESRKRSIKFRVQLLCCAILAAVCDARIILLMFTKRYPPFDVIPEALGIGTWMLSVFVMLEERIRFLPNNWILRGYWIAELIVTGVKLPMVAQYWRTHSHRINANSSLVVVQFCLQVIIIFFLMFKQQARYFRPASTSTAAAATTESMAPSVNSVRADRDLGDLVSDPDSASQDFSSRSSDRASGRRYTEPDDVNVLSYLTFHFIRNVLRMRGDYKSRPKIELTDLTPLAPKDRSSYLSTQFRRYWEAESRKLAPSIASVLAHLFWRPFVWSGIVRLLYQMTVFGPPLSLYFMIQFCRYDKAHQRYPWPEYSGFAIAGAVFSTTVIGSVLVNNYSYVTYRVGQRIRSIIVTAVYRKCLVLSGLSRHKFPPGVVINHMAVDPTVMVELVPTAHLLWASPLEIVSCLVILVLVAGWSTLVGAVIMLVATPINLIIARGLYTTRIASLAHKDTRIKLLSEVLSAIKTIKLMVWETHLHGQLNESRLLEVKYLFKFIFLRSLMIVVIWNIPLIGTLATFVCLLFVAKKPMTVEVAFMCFTLYNQLNVPLIRLPKLMNDFILSLVSLRRITAFLLAHEVQADNVENHVFNPSLPAISVERATFIWEDTDKPALSGIDVSIPHGQLVAVIGQVGSGKTAFLRALLGSIKRSEGSATVSGQLAYAAQNPWIQNISFRSNVTFGHEFDGEWYDKVVNACELRRDVQILTGGDTAEIGEAGSTLSGGQKQRLALARAVYQDADIYLLDDTLSAVDANVGEAIFNNCVRGVLAGKTRILVTQQYQYLSRCDYILVLKAGEIVERGTYAELAAQKDSEFVRLNSSYEAQVLHAEEKKEEKKEEGAQAAGTGALMTEEEHTKGSVPWHAYWIYVREGNWPLFTLTMILFVASTASAVYSTYWLSDWTTSEAGDGNSSSSFSGNGGVSSNRGILVYSIIITATCVMMVLRFLFLSVNNMNASKGIHDKTLLRILQAPMSFFHTTPAGRILNRFSEDLMTIDDRISLGIGTLLGLVLLVAIGIVTVVYVQPFTLPASLILVFMFMYIQEWYMVYARELFRLDAIARSPLYARFSETIQGIDTIRCMQQTRRFVRELEGKLDVQQRAFYAMQVAQRWLGIRIDVIAALYLFFNISLCTVERGFLATSVIAFVVSASTSTVNLLPQLVQAISEVKLTMVSVQRCVHFLELPQEGPLLDRDAQVVPPPSWPAAGKVEFRNYKLQYRPELPPAIIDLSLSVASGEKIGVVGRTGAGKSSMIVALFRLCEAAGGSVFVDGIDISKVALRTLRQRLCVIPQEPVLFRGTLRKNLDILSVHSEEELLDALEAVNLREAVMAKPGGLDCEVNEGGQNFSIGERQLICLARGLLAKSPIIVLDEATANIDRATEERVHQVIFTKTGRSTMFMIAHRTMTILKCDRVLMLERGQVIAFGTPAKLMEESPEFQALIKKSGVKDMPRTSPDAASAAPRAVLVELPPDSKGKGKEDP